MKFAIFKLNLLPNRKKSRDKVTNISSAEMLYFLLCIKNCLFRANDARSISATQGFRNFSPQFTRASCNSQLFFLPLTCFARGQSVYKLPQSGLKLDYKLLPISGSAPYQCTANNFIQIIMAGYKSCQAALRNTIARELFRHLQYVFTKNSSSMLQPNFKRQSLRFRVLHKANKRLMVFNV